MFAFQARLRTKTTRRWLAALPFTLVLASILLLGLGRTAQAAPISPQDFAPKRVQSAPVNQDGPIQARVGIYVLSVGNLDMTSGGYTMDFYLNFTCDRPCASVKFDIMNASSAPEWDDQTLDTRGNTFYTYRVRANLITQLDLERYPFDEHQLAIELEDKSLDTSSLVFEVDPGKSGIDKHVLVSGWNLRPEWDASVEENIFPLFDNSAYSRYRFFVSIYHPWQASFLKGLFAAIVIVGGGMLSFLLAYDDSEDRINLTSSTLASAIFYHLTLTSSIPPVGYLTFADKFMILQYLFISASLGVAVALMILCNRARLDLAKNLHKATRVLVPAAWVVAMIGVAYLAL